jgi:hypothetical protein
MSGPSRSGLRTLIGNTFGGGLVVVVAPPEPEIRRRPIVIPGIGKSPPPPPPPPKPPKPGKRAKGGGNSGGAGGSDWIPCPPAAIYEKAIAERRLREILERAERTEAAIELWTPKKEPEKTPEEIQKREPDPEKQPEVIIVEVPVIVEVIKEVPIYVPVFMEMQPEPVLPPLSAVRYVTMKQIWPQLLIATAVAGVLVLMANTMEEE